MHRQLIMRGICLIHKKSLTFNLIYINQIIQRVNNNKILIYLYSQCKYNKNKKYMILIHIINQTIHTLTHLSPTIYPKASMFQCHTSKSTNHFLVFNPNQMYHII